VGLEPPAAALQLGASWLHSPARAAQRAQRRLDRRLLLTLERGVRAASKRSMGSALAALRGAHARFLLRKPEALVGRSTDEQKVDVDLALEGNASKVSRQHAFIQRRRDGLWYIRNIGRRSLFVNNAAVETGARAQLQQDCLIEIGGLRLIFRANTRPRTAKEDAGKPKGVKAPPPPPPPPPAIDASPRNGAAAGDKDGRNGGAAAAG